MKFATGRTTRTPGAMNKSEAAYELLLKVELGKGAILWYRFEGITLKLGPDCRYTPDFFCQSHTGELQAHEVKGTEKCAGKEGPRFKARFEDDARAKISVAAGMFPIRFFVVYLHPTFGWLREEVGA